MESPVFCSAPSTGRLGQHALALGACVSVAALGTAQGGYFPAAWGWITLPLLWAVSIALALGRQSTLEKLDLALVLLMSAFVAWSALSVTWSASVPATVLEVQRGLIWIAVVAAVVVLCGRRQASSLIGGVLAGITLVSALAVATCLFPERLGVYDVFANGALSEPLGYSNGMGVFAGLGMLLALGFATDGSDRRHRMFAASVVPLLATAVWLSGSRGATGGIVVGLVTALALHAQRLRLLLTALALTPYAALAMWAASRSSRVGGSGWPPEAGARDGHRLALLIILLAAGAALTMLAFDIAARYVRVRVRPGLAAGTVVAAVLAGGLLVGVASPELRSAVRHPLQILDSEQRVGSTRPQGRVDLWRAAWQDARSEPVHGAGAGTFEQYWYRHRDAPVDLRDAHNVYLQALAELGAIGLVILLAALAMPLVAVRRARGQPLAAVAAGAYVASLAHAAFDWDWKLPALTGVALLCGASLTVLARTSEARTLRRPLRLCAVAAGTGVAALAFVGLIGSNALEAGARAWVGQDLATAEREARKAIRWQPWSSEPHYLLGEVQLSSGDRAGARAAFRDAIAKDPQNWYLRLSLARVSAAGARRAALREAARLNPLGPEIAELSAAR